MPPRDMQVTLGHTHCAAYEPGVATLTMCGRELCPSVLAEVQNFNHLTVSLLRYFGCVRHEQNQLSSTGTGSSACRKTVDKFL